MTEFIASKQNLDKTFEVVASLVYQGTFRIVGLHLDNCFAMEEEPVQVRRKKRGKDLDEVQCGGIITSKRLGMSVKNIAKVYKKSRTAIYKVLRKYKAHEVLGRKPGCGRKRKTTKYQDRMILREVKKDRKATREEIRESLELDVSDRTIRRRISESGEFKSYWATKKPFINENNRKKRVEWCMRHRNWTVEQWRSVIWSDESPFVLRFNKKVRGYGDVSTKGTIRSALSQL